MGARMRFRRSVNQPYPSFSQVQMGANPMTLEQRIEALEKRCKRLGKTLVGVGTLALFAVVAGTAGWTVAYTGKISPSSITTKTIFLKDKYGKTRLTLFGSSGTLSLKDKTGKTRILLSGNSILSMNDKAGKSRVLLSGTGSLYAKDSAGKTRVGIYGNDGSVRAYEKAGKTRVALYGENGLVRIFDKAGEQRVWLFDGGGEAEGSISALQTRQRFLIPNCWETTSITAGR